MTTSSAQAQDPRDSGRGRQRLIRRLALAGVWCSVVLALCGFVTPWVSLEVKKAALPGALKHVSGKLSQLFEGTPLDRLTGRLAEEVGQIVVKVQHGTETITARLPDLAAIPSTVSGVEIPRLAAREDTKLILMVTEMLTGNTALAAKSYLVYLLPGLALLCGLIVTMGRRLRVVCGMIGVLGITVAGLGCWKLLTTPIDIPIVTVTIGVGLWLLCGAYLGLGCSALVLWVAGPRYRTA